MRRLFVVICALLLYGSFYPWHFHYDASLGPGGALLRVFRSWPTQFSTGILQDIALNLIIYVPLGLIGYLALAQGPALAVRRLFLPVGVGFCLSLFVETVQSFVPGRVPSAMDLLCNAAGSAFGVVVGVSYEAVIARVLKGTGIQIRRRPSSALMMLIVFASQMAMPALLRGYEWFTHQYSTPTFIEMIGRESRNTFAVWLATWLMAGRFLEVIVASALSNPDSKRTPLKTVAGLLVMALGVAVIRISTPLTHTEWEGAAAGVAVYAASALLCESQWRDRLLAAAAAAWLIGDGLRPYHFVARNQFDWVPFLGMLGSDWMNGVISLVNKTWMYGSAFWIWERVGLARPVCAAILMTVLAAIEYAQQYLPGRTSTMTDLAMGAIAIGLLWGVERKYGS